MADFSEYEKLIRENPKQADAQAFEWQQFLKANAPISPELGSIETSEEFYKWVSEHPEKNVDPSVWAGKEISEAYYYLRGQHENEQMQQSGNVDSSSIPQELAALPFLAASFLERPKIMEADKEYQKIEENLKKEWLEKNNAKDFSSKEGIDYLYGSLEDKTKASIAKGAEEKFRNNPKFQKRVERYDKEAKKIYKDHRDDPKWQTHQFNAQMEINGRLALLEKSRDKKAKISKEEIKKSQNEIIEQVNKKSQGEFAAKFPEKAKVYHEREEQQRLKQQKKEEKRQQETSPLDVKKFVRKFQKGVSGQPTTFPSQTGRLPQTARSVGSGINRGAGAAGRAGAALGRAGGLATQAAARGIMAFLATPPGWITVLVIIVILIIVFVIVLIMGRGKYSNQITGTNQITGYVFYDKNKNGELDIDGPDPDVLFGGGGSITILGNPPTETYTYNLDDKGYYTTEAVYVPGVSYSPRLNNIPDGCSADPKTIIMEIENPIVNIPLACDIIPTPTPTPSATPSAEQPTPNPDGP